MAEPAAALRPVRTETSAARDRVAEVRAQSFDAEAMTVDVVGTASGGDEISNIGAVALAEKERGAVEPLGDLEIQVQGQCAAVDRFTDGFTSAIDKLSEDLAGLRTEIVRLGEETKAGFVNNLQLTKDAVSIGKDLEARIVDLRARQAKLPGSL
jgi:hypothetical protein